MSTAENTQNIFSHLAQNSAVRRWTPYFIAFLANLYFFRFFFHENVWNDAALGGNDWDRNFFYMEAIVKSIREYSQLPFWNPYYVGGIPVLDNPQVNFFTPTTLLALFFGSVKALKFSILLHALIGTFGCLYFFRSILKIDAVISLLCAGFFVFGGWYAMRIFAGHANFFSFQLLPFAAAFFFQFLRDGKVRHLAAAAAFESWFLLEGNVYGFFYTIFCAGFYSASSATLEMNYRYFVKFLIFSTLVLLLCSFRFIPQAVYYNENGAFFRTDLQLLTLSNALDIFTSSNQNPEHAKNWTRQEYRWWEYGNFTGYLPFLLILSSIRWFRKKDLPFVLLSILTLVLMLGNFHVLSPFHLLSYFPGFSNTRCSGRWGIVFVFLLATGSAVWTQRMISGWSQAIRYRKITSAILLSLCMFSYYNLVRNNSIHLRNIFSLSEPAHGNERIETIRTIGEYPDYGAASSMYPAIRRNYSVLNGYENLNSPRAGVPESAPAYTGEIFLLSGRRPLAPDSWSPNQIRLHTDSSREETIVINQNFHSGWKSDNPAHVVKRYENRLSVVVPPGKNSILLYYFPVYTAAGSVISISTILLLLFIFWKNPGFGRETV